MPKPQKSLQFDADVVKPKSAKHGQCTGNLRLAANGKWLIPGLCASGLLLTVALLSFGALAV